MRIKSGLGYDIHRLVEGRPLYLGGIQIPFPRGLHGHSDGDCLVHAIMDALLGAMGEKDIGQHFSDQDPRHKNRRSLEMLQEVMRLMHDQDHEILNIDSLVIAEEPKLGPYMSEIKETLCTVLSLTPDKLGIKARTNEGLGAIGRGEAIAAWAVVLIRKKG